MASSVGSVPDVAKCLNGDEVLVGWKDVLDAILTHNSPPSLIYEHFIDSHKHIISLTVPSFSTPNPTSKSATERALSPINLPSESQQKEVEQIKSDSQWLSVTQDLDEVEALRIVLLEWQNRPELRLNTGFADAELASLRDALGAEYAQTLDLTPGGRYGRSDDLFDSHDARRSRILQMHQQSQAAVVAVARESLEARYQPPHADAVDHKSSWLRLLRSESGASLKESVVAIATAIRSLIGNPPQPHKWDGIDPAFHEELENGRGTTTLQRMAIFLQILLLRVHFSAETVTSDILEPWMILTSDYAYFSQFRSDDPVQQTAIDRIQTTTSFVSLALLTPAFAMDYIENPEIMEAQPGHTGNEYFLDTDKIEDLHRTLMPYAITPHRCAGPTVLAWGLVFYKMKLMGAQVREARENRYTQKAIDRASTVDSAGRRVSSSSAGSVGDSIFEQVSSQIRSENGISDPLQYMLESAVRGSSVFEYIIVMAASAKAASSLLQSLELQILQDLVAVARAGLGYTPDIFNAQLAVLSTTKDDATETAPYKPLLNFIAEPFLTENFLDVAASRFPYEALPFLRIAKLLAKGGFDSLFRDGTHYITHRLQMMEFFTQPAVGGFESFQTTQEDKDANLVVLDGDVGILDHRTHRLLTMSTSTPESSQVVPAGTLGEVISNAVPPVIRWHHSYSALKLLGRWLELHVKGELAAAVSSFENADDVAAATIGVVGTLLSTTHARAVQTRTTEQAESLYQEIIHEASTELENGRDIVDCIFDLVEQQFVSTRRFSPAAGCDLLTACVDFISILCKTQPLRIWPALVKSALFSAYGAKRTIFSIISTVEMPLQSFSLLESCSSLLNAVMDLVLTVSSRSSLVKGLKSRAALFQRPLAATVLGLVETMYAAFEAIPGWTFALLQQKQSILDNLCSAFSNLLYYAFGTGTAFNVDHGVNMSFRPAADFLLSALSGIGIQSLGSGPIALNLVSSTLNTVPDVFSPHAGYHLKSIVWLARTHLGCSRLTGHALKEVNTTLVSLFPILIRLPILYSPLLRPTLALECDIYDAFPEGSRPHLLGYLGAASCLSFLDSLKYLNARAWEEAHISWRLISRLIAPDQQWTAIVLITGSPPGRERENSRVRLATRGKPLLDQAINKLIEIDHLDPTVTVALLKLLQEAQLGWPAVSDKIKSRDDLFPALIKFVGSRTAYNNSDLSQAHHNEVAAGVTDLSVLTLHSIMISRDEHKFRPYIPLLQWLTKNAIEVAGYNSSLHSNLRRNFAMKYDGLNIDVVKRTGMLRVPYGNKYFYDLEFASKILNHDRYWNSGPQSFHAEFELANINLSVVESELSLLRSFKYLCSEHGSFFAKSKDVQVVMSHIAANCLRANMQIIPAEKLFDTLFQSRAEIGGMLLGPLVTAGAQGSDFLHLLRIAYDCARYRNGSYQLAITNDDLTYWRSMLNVLRLTMQFHVANPLKTTQIGGTKTHLEFVESANTLICDIGAHIIGQGLSSIVAALQDQKQRSRATNGSESDGVGVGVADVMLLSSILQTILRLPSLSQFSTQLAEGLISTDAAQSCMLLYSWSHILLADGEPVYANLAVQMLVTLSKLPLVAEHLAVEGILSRLLSAKMTQKIQTMPQGVGHLDRRPNAAMYYSLWSDGFLRIALNLVESVGGGIAGEVSTFLIQFPQQLIRASLSFSASPTRGEGSDGLTLGAACEVANLSLLSRVLESYRLAGASSAVDPSQVLPLAGFDEHRKAVAADLADVENQDLQYRLRRVVPTNETESIWAKKKIGDKELESDGTTEKMRSTLLDQKILAQLRDARRCLSPDSED